MRPLSISPFVLLAMLAAVSAFAETNVIPPVTATTFVASPADFHNADGTGHALSSFSGFMQQGGGSGHLIAPVELPKGAVITMMNAWLGDSEAAGDFVIQLRRKRRGNNVPAQVISTVSSTGIDPAGHQFVSGTPPSNPIVDEQYLYYLTTAADVLDSTTQRIYAVMVHYQLTLFADGFESGDTSAWGAAPPAYQTKWITAARFSSAAKTTSWFWVFDATLGTFSLPNDTNATPPCGVAPLELPHGATVAGFLANLYDVRADRGLTLRLRRSPINSLVVSTEMASVSTSPSTGWQIQSDFSVTNPVIDNDNYWYYFELCMAGGVKVGAGELAAQAVRVLYTP